MDEAEIIDLIQAMDVTYRKKLMERKQAQQVR